jgi:hypothetical protein
MQPGIPLTALHGKIKQDRRTIVFQDFLRRKSACMFATDIASRGLDFPDIDWVVQVDAPEDTNMYIHRVGRTARYNSGGRALLMLLPTEEINMTKGLQDAGVPIKRLTVNPKNAVSVGSVAANYLVAHPDCRSLAKKSFTGYLRSLQLLPGKYIHVYMNVYIYICMYIYIHIYIYTNIYIHIYISVYIYSQVYIYSYLFEIYIFVGKLQQNVNKLPLDAFAISLGLGITPDVPVPPNGEVEISELKEKKNVNRSLDKIKKQIKAAKDEKKRVCRYIYTYVCTYICINLCTYTCIKLHVIIYNCMYIDIRIYMYLHIAKHVHIYIYMYIG